MYQYHHKYFAGEGLKMKIPEINLKTVICLNCFNHLKIGSNLECIKHHISQTNIEPVYTIVISTVAMYLI